MNQRVMAPTKCNDTSSRSHCFALITLLTYESRKIVDRTFIFGDLSGSERVSKTGNSMWVDRDAGKLYTPGIEGMMTNWDLYQLGLQLDIITESLRQKGKGKSLVKHDSRLTEILLKSIDGEALTSVVFCLSQSTSNGGESWWTLNYGAKFTKLIAKVEP